MDKNLVSYQVQLQLQHGCSGIKSTGRVRILKNDEKSGHKAGEKVLFTRYGTFGGWDEQNRWIDFYNTEMI